MAIEEGFFKFGFTYGKITPVMDLQILSAEQTKHQHHRNTRQYFTVHSSFSNV